MVDIQFDIALTGESPESGALLDPLEIRQLLDSTQHHIAQHIHNRLDGQTCEVHGEPPKVIVTGAYDLDTEQLDVQYNIEACCNLMIMRSAALLGR
jgi:hypothetical protein